MKVSRVTNSHHKFQLQLVCPPAMLLFPSLFFWTAGVNFLEQHPNTLNTRWSKDLTKEEHFILTCLYSRQTARVQARITSPSSQQGLFPGVETALVLAHLPSSCMLSFPLYYRLEFTGVLPCCFLCPCCLVYLLTSLSCCQAAVVHLCAEKCTFSIFLLRSIRISLLGNYHFRNWFSEISVTEGT